MTTSVTLMAPKKEKGPSQRSPNSSPPYPDGEIFANIDI